MLSPHIPCPGCSAALTNFLGRVNERVGSLVTAGALKVVQVKSPDHETPVALAVDVFNLNIPPDHKGLKSHIQCTNNINVLYVLTIRPFLQISVVFSGAMFKFASVLQSIF